MSLSGVIGFIIGLILLLLLLSLICSALQEAVAGLRHQRAEFLHAAIGRLLGPLSEQLYRHPLVEAISPNLGPPRLPLRVRKVPPPPNPEEAPPVPRVVKPSYIPSRTFALALLSVLSGDPGATAGPGRRQDLLDAAAAALGNRQGDAEEVRRLKETLRLLLADADRELEGWQRGIARWFDDVMDRYSGWYKRRTQIALLLYGLVIGSVLNADLFVFANALWNDGVLRASVVAEAQRIAETEPIACPSSGEDAGPGSTATDPLECVADRIGSLQALRVPMGWPDWPWRWATVYRAGDDLRFPHSPGGVALKLAGLVLTAIAVAQGSGFWFQLLNRFVNLRLTGRPPPKEEGDA